MLKLDYDPSLLSREEVNIGGISTYIYNADALNLYVEQFQLGPDVTEIGVNVLYLIHHRGGDYTYTEAVGQKIITQVAKQSKVPLIGVTFDIRNHGLRLVNAKNNSSWRSGNETHAFDMISCIDGTVLDLRLVMDFLPAYLNLDARLNDACRRNDVQLKFNNILSGYSVGAHAVLRFALKYPSSVAILNPNIGCVDLTSLLVNRLKGTADFDKRWFYKTYEELGLSADEQKRYPKALHKIIAEQDIGIFENFPSNRIKLFATFFTEDPVVPPRISRLWTELYMNANTDSEVFYETGREHDITPAMIDNFTAWLVKQL